ncbi:hypothetical protein [Ulvibacter antarcticus]|uniref:Uncharacterized protein n=1 Tax=Ulvibacter antarcticus TaxID=442714 RepID=A0A3L9YKG3_9FLAO|nr:hypothetical protein [Ulvibacter antarcticus]RMA58615.1 hypothetical protein BXY75_1989 [Ulvibacter antarcticus]
MTCFSQHTETQFCTLQSENEAWLSVIKAIEDVSQQVDLVIDKVLADNHYFITHPEIEDTNDKRIFGTLPCTTDCSIRFGLIYGKNKGMVLDPQTYPNLEILLLEFNSENIEQIKVKERYDNDIYSYSSGMRSGIVLYTNDKELKKKIRRFLKNQSKEKVETETTIAKN